jgi:hypothetical protein
MESSKLAICAQALSRLGTTSQFTRSAYGTETENIPTPESDQFETLEQLQWGDG